VSFNWEYDGRLSRLHQRSRRPPRVRRTRRGFQHAMADDYRGEGKGQVGIAGLRSLVQTNRSATGRPNAARTKIKHAAQIIAALAFYAAVACVVYHLFWGPRSSSVSPTASCRDGTLSIS
jgi:hypothetical protein